MPERNLRVFSYIFPVDQDCHQNTEDQAYKYLTSCVSYEFLKSFFGSKLPFSHGLNELHHAFNDLGLFSGFLPDSHGVVHDDQSHDAGYGKHRGIPSAGESSGYGNRGDGGGMAAGHAAVSDKAFPYDVLVYDQKDDDFGCLGTDPGNAAGNKNFVLCDAEYGHNESPVPFQIKSDMVSLF